MSSPKSANRPEARSIAWTLSRRLGMVIVLALAFLLSATITIYTLFRIGDTRVPDVIGKPETEAQKIAEKAGLKVKITRRNDPATPADTVIETRPGPNSSVKKESSLTIVVSSGPAQTKGEFKINEEIFPAFARSFQVQNQSSPEIKNPKLEARNYMNGTPGYRSSERAISTESGSDRVMSLLRSLPLPVPASCLAAHPGALSI